MASRYDLWRCLWNWVYEVANSIFIYDDDDMLRWKQIQLPRKLVHTYEAYECAYLTTVEWNIERLRQQLYSKVEDKIGGIAQ